jgi:hypothetical protein
VHTPPLKAILTRGFSCSGSGDRPTAACDEIVARDLLLGVSCSTTSICFTGGFFRVSIRAPARLWADFTARRCKRATVENEFTTQPIPRQRRRDGPNSHPCKRPPVPTGGPKTLEWGALRARRVPYQGRTRSLAPGDLRRAWKGSDEPQQARRRPQWRKMLGS